MRLRRPTAFDIEVAIVTALVLTGVVSSVWTMARLIARL